MNIPVVSPVAQDFIWFGEYTDGTHLFEFDPVTKQENSFYSLERDKLIRFGLLGNEMLLYYEVLGGIFKLNGRMIEVVYKTDKEYYLTGKQKFYKDIISYKDAEAIFNMLNGGGVRSNIFQFNFGYKVKLEFPDVNFNFKAICKIPFNKPVYLNFKLVADRDMKGVLQIKRNGLIVDEIDAPLKKNYSGELNWVVR